MQVIWAARRSASASAGTSQRARSSSEVAGSTSCRTQRPLANRNRVPYFAAARRSGVERVTANPARSLVHLSGSITLADVLAAFEGTTYRSVVQRGA